MVLSSFNHIFKPKVFNYKISQLINLPDNVIYNTVLDVPKYSNFIPWCHKSIWLTNPAPLENGQTKGYRNALLSIQFAIFNESYTSKVIFEDYKHIQAVAADSRMFEVLDTNWEINGMNNKTMVDFYICYKFNNPLYQHVSTSFSTLIAKTMLDCFIKESYKRYYNDLKSSQLN